MKKFKLASIGLLLGIMLIACSNDKDSGHEENNTPEETISADQFANEFLANNFETIYNQTSESFQEMVSVEEFKELGSDFNQGVNSYELVSEMPIQDLTEYRWISDGGDKGISSHFADDQTIEAIQLTPVTSHPESDEVYTENTYQIPMTGEWFTFWGGTNELVNYHYAVESQRYAYDWVILEEDSTYEGDPTKNESYYAFGKDVVAPREGTVVSVENDIPDNTPTVDTNAEEPLGNHVILEHENNEYSFIAHFKQGSLEVDQGDQVTAGDLLGSVGNSGNSSEPHIHFHVADGADLEASTSIRIKLKDGEEPVRGDVIEGFQSDSPW
ncbi:Peptidase family M23 [Gracilibacillus orientalis]|uniref:Peptidase family M23 n=1 Tax=Gracilibacillus orientalis TaxID=334253 RepID=A0A1I4HU43_9BACI|nr:peptidoglycan DD-metalloendopeptidase family protein [Gracilibacillus orientalis]SFL45141.1 Peptidase family M23 [Gracilibacillus orientalis]